MFFSCYYCALSYRLRLGQHFRMRGVDGSFCQRGKKSPCEAEEF